MPFNCSIPENTDNYVIAWRCWVEVNSQIVEYNSIQHSFCDIPNDGFQAMRLWYNDGGGRFISGNDFYFFQSVQTGIIFGQSNDLDISTRYPGALIKRGKHIPDGVMQQVDQMMLNSTIPQ